MATFKRQIITGASVIYLLALTGLASYALHSANTYSLPIPNATCAITIALPALAGIALEAVLSLNDSLARKGQLQTSRVFQIVVASFLVLESVLATLAGTHYSPPGSLDCALGERWEMLFRGKHSRRLRMIQDTFSCCGFRTPTDRAWPFADADHGADACVLRYEREGACLEPWRGEERMVAIMLMVVPVGVFLWKVAILLAPSSQSSWLPSHVSLPDDDGQSASSGPRRARAAAARYRDVEGQAEGERRGDSLQRTVTDLNKDSHLASHVEAHRTKSAGLLEEPYFRRERGRDDRT